ncbi:MAG TPA: chorismate-binding protein [Thermoplasmata archaeon]|nr:chorismate-binding protein [Thermoplasmata archaeon]
MTPGPWERFVAESAGAENAGYVERAGVGDRPGRAVWFRSPGSVLTLGPDAEAGDVRRSIDRHLADHRWGAVVGYLGFDAVGLVEPALRRFPSGAPFPLGELAFVPEARRGVVPPQRRRPLPRSRVGRPLADSLPRPRFESSVRRLVRAIRDGEAFQVVLAHRRSWRRPEDLLERGSLLRAAERYSTFYYLRFGDRELLGASPESVAELHGRTAYIDPIAGTMPRDPRRRRRRGLRSDPKELCEHRMLVDLARNDLGTFARAGSVRLAWTERLVRYARLEHLVSRVAATVRPGTGPWDVLSAAFPAGTVSGAPKIRATQLLRDEERSWRGPYAGAVALMEPGPRATFALAIRSAFASGDRLHTAAGAGIVHRSSPSREFGETIAKLSAIETAVVGRGP